MNQLQDLKKVSKEKFFEGWKDTFETAEEKRDGSNLRVFKTAGKSDSRKCRI